MNKNNFNNIISLLSEYKKDFFHAIVLTLNISIIGILESFVLSFIIDNVLQNEATVSLITISIILVTITICGISLKGLKSLIIRKISYKLEIDLMERIFKKIVGSTYSFIETHTTGELLSRANDIKIVKETLSNGLISSISNIIMFFTVGIVLYNLNKILFLLQIIALFLLSFIVIFYGKLYAKEYPLYMEENANFQSFLTESFNGIETIKTYPAAIKFEEIFKAKQKRFTQVGWNIEEQNIKESTYCGVIEKITNILLIILGSLLIIQEKMTLGEVANFVVLSNFFANSIGNLLDLQADFQESFSAINRFFDILNEKSEKEISSIKNDFISSPLTLSVKEVSFSYNRNQIYNKLNIEVRSGQWVSLVGKTGCGKSTFIRFLLKLCKPQQGTIYINSQDLQKIETYSLRNMIGYVPQDIVLFSGTILENITMFDRTIPTENVMKLVKEIGLENKILNLQDGINTRIGERGHSLSGGEKQKIAICRALIKNPQIILLDEATSNLDITSEQEVLNIFEQQKNLGKTIISVAHRLSAIERCDKIFIIQNGKIMEEGSFEKLKMLNNCFSKS